MASMGTIHAQYYPEQILYTICLHTVHFVFILLYVFGFNYDDKETLDDAVN